MAHKSNHARLLLSELRMKGIISWKLGLPGYRCKVCGCDVPNNMIATHVRTNYHMDQAARRANDMNITDAIKQAKQEMGLNEKPDMKDPQWEIFTRRVYDLCHADGEKPPEKIFRLEEF